MKLTRREDLRRIYAEPSRRSLLKQMERLDSHCRRLISYSPLVIIGSVNAQGQVDVSPRGGEPGFVKVLSDTELLLPDRSGNNRLDTLQNLLERPGLGMLFMVPGVDDTLRVNGTVRITADAALLGPLELNGQAPPTGLLLEVHEVFLQCPKALMRARIWSPERRVPLGVLPTMGQMLADQIEDRENKSAEEEATPSPGREKSA
ncbi:MAG: pyridoxamine 5'-phosphate oxidase family protein [Deltaproteobacteria bacterium]|nr:pyridoxamine 5'-phosphate oxidase family protein [Deltaproteobacteria bacterium]